MSDSAFRVNRGITLNPQASAPSNPTAGDIYYDSSLNTYVFYNNGNWVNLANRTDVASATTLTSTTLTASVTQSSLVRITGSTSSNLYGLAASTGGKQLIIYNESSQPLLINNNSATEPTASNRILTYNSGTATIAAGQTAIFIYDDSQARWILASSPGTGGSGSGVGDDLDALQFRASFTDLFADLPTSTTSSINPNTAYTNATYSASQNIYVLSYDAGKTATAIASSTSVSISATPAFTVAAGDVLVNLATGEVRKITVVTTQTSYTIEAAFAEALTAQAVVISQAVHTIDVYNSNVGSTGAALSAAFPGSSMSEIMVDYKDNNVSGSNLFTPDVGPYVGFVASVDNTNWSTAQYRPTLDTTQIQSVICPTSGTSLYLRFFADESSGSGTVNLIMYKAFMQKSPTAAGTNNVLWSAYGVTNGSTTPINCTIGLTGGKTTITITNGYTYPVGSLSGQTVGALKVTLNGQLLPRFVSGSVLTTDAYYTEVSPSVIQLDQNYSTQSLDVQVSYDLQVIDSSTTNTTQITANQNAQASGFQGFIDQTSFINVATTTVGSPVAGTFYSSITGRASMVDLSQDLQPRFGIQRIMVQTLQQNQTEFGPNGIPVWSTPNDQFGQIRYIGNWLAYGPSNNGAGWYTQTTGDSIEVTFYGTGINLLTWVQNTARTATVFVDGVSNSTITLNSASNSSVLNTRNYAENIVLPVISGLSLGIHTVTIQLATGGEMDAYGLEIINQVSSGSNLINVNSGNGYIQGQKYAAASQSTFAYNAPVVGTTGGRVAVYETASGTISQVFTQNATSPSYTTSTSHANEEVVRVIQFNEFGAGRSDDFSQFASGGSGARAFTLDDGTTTLFYNSGALNILASGVAPQNVGDFIAITFVGTGLDFIDARGAATGYTYSLIVDGVTQATGLTSSYFGNGLNNQVKVVSGLPYGTHTVQFVVTTASGSSLNFFKFIIYQPKTPAIPSGAIQIGSYNVMATYAANSTAGLNNIGTGLLRKFVTRELNYFGTWTINGPTPASYIGGWETYASTSGSYFQYTFFGTGFELRGFGNTTQSSNSSLTIDGLAATTANFSSLVSSAYGGWSFSAGTLSQAVSSTAGSGVSISGLPLGIHTIKLTNNTSSNMIIEAVDIITPIYSYKSNLYADLQNTLSVGSNGISDDRQITPIKNALPATKAWAQAQGITANPTTTSTTLVPMPDMSCNIKTSGGPLRIAYSVELYASTSGAQTNTQIYVDGVAVGTLRQSNSTGTSTDAVNSDTVIVVASPGYHKIDLYWSTSGSNTITANQTNRSLVVEEK